MDVREAVETMAFTLPRWSTAEFLDIPYARGLMLRALICRLGPNKWQWSVMSIDGNYGEVISIGTARSRAKRARPQHPNSISACATHSAEPSTKPPAVRTDAPPLVMPFA
jgi:hypothetical protein